MGLSCKRTLILPITCLHFPVLISTSGDVLISKLLLGDSMERELCFCAGKLLQLYFVLKVPATKRRKQRHTIAKYTSMILVGDTYVCLYVYCL